MIFKKKPTSDNFNFNKIVFILSLLLIIYIIGNGFKNRQSVTGHYKEKSYVETQREILQNKSKNAEKSFSESLSTEIMKKIYEHNNIKLENTEKDLNNDDFGKESIDLPYKTIKVNKYDNKIGKGKKIVENEYINMSVSTMIEGFPDYLITERVGFKYKRSALPVELYSFLYGMHHGGKRTIITNPNEIMHINQLMKKIIIPIDNNIINQLDNAEDPRQLILIIEVY